MARTKGPRGYESTKDPITLRSECEQLLADFGAESVHTKYDEGDPIALAFVLKAPNGSVPYRLEPNVEGVRRRMQDGPSGKASPRTVAWFQTRQLLEILLEFNESGLASATTLLAGMAVNPDTGQTVGEMLEDAPDDLLMGRNPLLKPGKE